MKKFNNLGEYLKSVRELPEIQELIRHPYAPIILEPAFASAFAEAFRAWYEARTYRALCENGQDNGYPGDRAAFSLALKSAFFQYRYAWGKVTIDRALEALARSLPDVEEVDGYEETQSFVESMKRRNQILTATDESNPLEQLQQALQSILGGIDPAERDLEVATGANPVERLQERLKNLRSGQPTPGCDCPRCTAIRAKQEGGASADAPVADPFASMPPELRRFLEDARSADRLLSPREQIIQQSEQIREAIAEGRIQEVVDETLASIPPNVRAVNIQAGLTLSSELGFGDIVNPYVRAVNANGKFPGFTALPITGSQEETEYNNVLARAREQVNA